MSFYLTLPSNNNSVYFPDNKTSSYSTYLKNSLSFDQQYEVGLAELIYTQSWNVELGKITIQDSIDANTEFNYTIFVHDGSNVLELIKIINEKLQDLEIDIEYKRRYNLGKSKENETLKFDSQTNIYDINRYKTFILCAPDLPAKNLNVVNDIKKRIYEPARIFLEKNHKLNFSTNNLIIKFSERLQQVLHLEDKFYQRNDISENPIKIDHLNLVKVMFIYTDIIRNQFVGETYAPLLRNVVVHSKFFQPIAITFENPHYVSLNKSEIITINISIRDEFGDEIKFDEGNVITKLHFRPIKYF